MSEIASELTSREKGKAQEKLHIVNHFCILGFYRRSGSRRVSTMGSATRHSPVGRSQSRRRAEPVGYAER